MTDDALHERISELVEEEHRLRAADGRPDGDRLAALERQLDQAWDLLRRRQAAREHGEDPAQVSERPQAEVEGYLQ